MPGTPPTGAVGGEIELLQALQRRWLLAVTVGLLLAGIGVGATFFVMPLRYTARALLHIASKQPQIIFPNQNEVDFNNYQRTQKALIKSRPVLNAALKDPKVADLAVIQKQLDPLDWIETKLNVDMVAPEILEVSMIGETPEELEAIVAAVTKAYLQEIVDKEKNQRVIRMDQLSQLQNQFNENLKAKRSTYQKLVKMMGAGDAQTVGFKQRLAAEMQAQAKQMLLNLQPTLHQLEVEAKVMEEREKAGTTATGPIPESLIVEAMKKDPTIAELLVKKERLQQRMKDTEKYVEKDKLENFLTRPRGELRDIEKSIEERRKEIRPEFEKELRLRAKDSLSSDLGEVKRKLELQQALQRYYEGEVKKAGEENRTLVENNLELETIKDDIAQTDMIAKKIGTEIQTLNVELQAPARVKTLEDAVVRKSKDIKKYIFMTSVAGVGMFCLGLFGVTWREYRAKRIKNPQEVVTGVGIRLIGTLPDLEREHHHAPKPTGTALTTVSPSRLLVEYVDATRARLLHAARMEPFRVILITSAQAGEGKTSLACHLSASLARAGRKTLLLDCDLRRPSTHRMFDLPSDPGFCEVLRGEVEMTTAIRPTFLEGLDLLTGGRWDNRATEALAHETRFRTILNRLRGQYDFIVVDSSPVLAVSDTLWISQYVDAAMFAILYNVSHLPSVRAAYQELTSLGTRILGAVVGGTPTTGSGYHYTQYYAGYYGPREGEATKEE